MRKSRRATALTVPRILSRPPQRALFYFPHAPASPLSAPSASPTRPPRQGTPDPSSVSLIRVFAACVSSSSGSPPLTQRPQAGAETGMP